jgi:hypothetical protein
MPLFTTALGFCISLRFTAGGVLRSDARAPSSKPQAPRTQIAHAHEVMEHEMAPAIAIYNNALAAVLLDCPPGSGLVVAAMSNWLCVFICGFAAPGNRQCAVLSVDCLVHQHRSIGRGSRYIHTPHAPFSLLASRPAFCLPRPTRPARPPRTRVPCMYVVYRREKFHVASLLYARGQSSADERSDNLA